jgi:glycosyltransferase involved in cell wall biosynthesis
MVHNRYRQRGGEDLSFNAESDLLESHGHEVDRYMRDNLDIPDLENLAIWKRIPTSLNLGGHTVWSNRSFKDTKKRLESRPFDVMHVQNFFPQISPSVLFAAAEVGVPVVQTLRNYRLACAKGTLFREGAPCELCLGKRVGLPALRYRCYQDDLGATAAVVAMQAAHGTYGTWSKKVNIYVALTEFARSKAIETGLPAERIVVKPNFVADDPGPREGGGAHFVSVGRLSPEKGLDVLMKAWERLEIPLKIIGDGPLNHMARVAAARNRYIEFLGPLPPERVLEEMGDARATIVPTLWYETFGRVVIESFAVGTPVIASDLGAVSELIDEGRTGLLFRPGDHEDLARAVQQVASDGKRADVMRKEARSEFEARYTAAKNYPQLIDIYELAKRTPLSE